MSERKFSIAVTFLHDRYHGEEWPPAPARLFQALVAGVMTCGYQELVGEAGPALRWLEQQAAPEIRAMEAKECRSYRIAVPNNDFDVVAKDWLRGRPGEPNLLKTMKTISPRVIQGEGPHCEYVWRVVGEDADQQIATLSRISQCLHTLGWGVDMAYADMDQNCMAGVAYEPSDHGDEVRGVPMPGTYDDLLASYQRFTRRTSSKGVDAYTRPTMIRMQSYRHVSAAMSPAIGFRLLEPESGDFRSVSWQHGMQVAGWLRHAAAEHLRHELSPEFIQQYVEGHTVRGEESNRLSFLPLPSVLGSYGDGRVRRALITEPLDASGDTVRLLRWKLTGRPVTEKGNGPESDVRKVACVLGPAESGDRTMDAYLARERRVWRSVTPVVLHGFNADRRGQISVSKTERLLLRSFEMTGYPEDLIEGFSFQTGPLWRGTGHSSSMQVPKHLDGYPRLHVEVRFRSGVSGPVIAGLGRHYGIGLFASSRDWDA